MKYCCEFCNKSFDKEEEALNCERIHNEKINKQKALELEKDKREEEIIHLYDLLTEKISAFTNDYNSTSSRLNDVCRRTTLDMTKFFNLLGLL